MRPVSPSKLVTPVADRLLASDLPRLPADRRATAAAFVGRRTEVLPGVTRLGVVAVAAVTAVAVRLVGDRAIGLLGRLPGFAEYPRLIRSLGYAFIWETWPGTAEDGAPGRDTAEASP